MPEDGEGDKSSKWKKGKAMGQGGGASLPNWRIQAIHDLLVRRGSRGKQTVIYASSVGELAVEYGSAMGRLVEGRFIQAQI